MVRRLDQLRDGPAWSYACWCDTQRVSWPKDKLNAALPLRVAGLECNDPVLSVFGEDAVFVVRPDVEEDPWVLSLPDLVAVGGSAPTRFRAGQGRELPPAHGSLSGHIPRHRPVPPCHAMSALAR